MANYETVIDLMNDRERMRQDRDALAKALRDIAAIENQEFGPDWEEIERARKIANDALTAAGVGQTGDRS
jgi:hypothetical protein